MIAFLPIKKRVGIKVVSVMIAAITIGVAPYTAWQSYRIVMGQPAALLSLNLPPMNLTLVALNGTQLELNETDIGKLPYYESYGGFKNQLGNIKGLGNYTGVPLTTLCSLVGGITANNSLRITATDGYMMTFSYGQVNGDFITFDNKTGQQVPHNQPLTPILAYYFNDENVTDGPLRLAIVGPEGLVTQSIYWVKWVVKMEVRYIDDVAINNVKPFKTVVGQTYSCGINVTVANQGGFTETFNVTLYANITVVATSQNLILTNATSSTIIFKWNTTGVAYGNYIIWAYASPVPDETNTTNNNCTDGLVKVSIPGDVVDPYFKVDMGDISAVLDAFGSKLGADGNYWHTPPKALDPHSPNMDLDNNGKVDMGDITIALGNFAKHYP
jgi:hypothetical protein